MKSHTRLARIGFSIAGLGSLLWFLIRVVPKPSRASYPCMRVAAPTASSFVCWLLGTVASLTFVRKARGYLRQSRYVVAGLCLVAGGITAAVLFTTSDSPALASLPAAPLEPNAPQGTARGANPGRVVWVHDSTATNWGGVGDGHWWDSAHTDQAVVDMMLSRALRELSGQASDTAAWDALVRYFNRTHGRGDVGFSAGEKIMIKVNFVGFLDGSWGGVDTLTYELRSRMDYMNTSPQAIRALLRQLVHVLGARQQDITVGDPTALFPNQYYDYLHGEFPDVRYLDRRGGNDRVAAQFSSVPFYFSNKPTGWNQDYVPQSYAGAAYFINLANLKSHSSAGVTLCAKNHYGSLIRLPIGGGYYSLHSSLADQLRQMGNYRAMVDLMGHAHLGGKTLLYLIDGLYAGVHPDDTMPSRWDVAPFGGDWTSSLFASQDGVAIDCVGFDLLQLEGDPRAYPQKAAVEDYLIEAALADTPPSGTFYDPDHDGDVSRLSSLGVHEHWNNTVDRQYSRNLGTGDGIELIVIYGASAVAGPVPRLGVHGSWLGLRSRVVRRGRQTVRLTVPHGTNATLASFDMLGRRGTASAAPAVSSGWLELDLTGRAAGATCLLFDISGDGSASHTRAGRIMGLR
jgi:hypothetical protein